MFFNYKKKINNLDAMLLAAGRGERMRYKTQFIAKPLIKINETCVLEKNIVRIANAGIRKIVVNSSYQHLTIKKFIKNFKSRRKLPNILVTFEKERLDTGGGIKHAINNFKNSNLLIVNGDSHLSYKERDCPVKKLITNYNNSDMDILLLLSKKLNTHGYNGPGDYYKSNSSVASKLTAKDIGTFCKYIFTGWQIINKQILNDFSEKSFSLKRAYDLAEKKGRLYGVEHQGSFFHVGDLKSFTIIKKFFKI